MNICRNITIELTTYYQFLTRFFLSGGEKYTAVYTYAGQYEDELSFEEGDVITVLSKDEADWWKGELNGKSGVFPSNYVEPFKCKFTSL